MGESNIASPRDPDFIIVGAMKAGTTTLADILKAHNGISINKKELHFFNGSIHDVEWYREQLAAPSQVLTGEATPTYSFLPHVPRSIHFKFPKTKLVWIFRDPVQRTYSNYLHQYKKGNESRCFSRAIEDELESRVVDRFKCYVERSLYVEQVKRYLYFFDESQMFYLLFENLMKNPEAEVSKLLDFLGVARLDIKEIPHSNKTMLPRAPGLFKAVMGLMPWLKMRNGVRRKVWPHTAEKPPFPKETEEVLVQYFESYNRELEDLTGLPVADAWKYSLK